MSKPHSSWISLSRQIMEAPLSDYDMMSAPDVDFDPKRPSTRWDNNTVDPEHESFHRQSDRRFITHPKTKDMMVKFFKTSPLNFYLVFYNDKDSVPNPDQFEGKVDDTRAKVLFMQAAKGEGMLKHIDPVKLHKMMLDPKGVVVIHRHNDYDEMMGGSFPFTPWMIVHRTMHVITAGYDSHLESLLRNLQSNTTRAHALADFGRYDGTVGWSIFHMMTTKTYRDGSYTKGSMIDVWSELATQYLVTGGVKLKSPYATEYNGKPCENHMFSRLDFVATKYPGKAKGIAQAQQAMGAIAQAFSAEFDTMFEQILSHQSTKGLYIV